MLTPVGLKLEIEEERSDTENFYRQLFGRWPSTDCDQWGRRRPLLQLLLTMKHGKAVCRFFNLSYDDEIKQLPEPSEEEILAGLQEIREELADEVVAIYATNTDTYEIFVNKILNLRKSIQQLEADLAEAKLKSVEHAES